MLTREEIDYAKAARDLIKAPERWTQNAYARDAEGHKTSERSLNAVC